MNERLTYLLDRYLGKTATPSEMGEFKAMAGMPEYEAFVKTEIDRTLAESLEQPLVGPAIGEQVYARIVAEHEDLPKRQVFFKFTRALAAAVVIFGVGLGWYAAWKESSRSHTLAVKQAAPEITRTYRGKNFIKLPDGSTVMLKDSSELTAIVSKGKFQREVILTGDAYFDIAHDAGHTFVVHAGKVKTRVLGTAFNIRTQAGKVEVKVTRGLVEVGANQRVFGKLKAKEQISVNTESNAFSITHLKPIEPLPVAVKPLDFQETSYTEAFDEIGKRFNYQIFLENPQLGNCRVSATFTGRESLEEILYAICATRNLEFTTELDKVLIHGGTPCR